MDKIQFINDTGEAVSFVVLEETKINGMSYLLVTESEDEAEDAEAYILKELKEEESEAVYEMVDDEKELAYVSKIFTELLEDVNIEI